MNCWIILGIWDIALFRIDCYKFILILNKLLNSLMLTLVCLSTNL